MTTIVDSKIVVLCNCPECGTKVETENQFYFYEKLDEVYCDLHLREVECSCGNTFYASEHGLAKVPHEFLVNPPDPNSFAGKMERSGAATLE